VEGKHWSRAISRLERAAQKNLFYRRTADEWAKLLGVSRQRFHQIRELLQLPTHRMMVHQALTGPLTWDARAQALWRLGIYNRRGDCWETAHTRSKSAGTLSSLPSDVKGDKRKVLYRLRYGNLPSRSCFEPPSCGHPWCINPEHQKSVTIGVRLHRLALPRTERIAAALEAGERRTEIARREGVHPDYVSQINLGIRGRGVRKKYPIRASLYARNTKAKQRA
jgi:hypothetical protein